MTKHILYGGQLSYFTGKARAYLRWKDIPFEEHLATREIYKTIIVPRIGYRMIPVLITPDDLAIQDTTEIIDHFETITPKPSVFPSGPRQRLAAHLLELYGDEWLVIPAMHYRWTHNRDFAYAEFGKLVSPDATPEQQYEDGKKTAEQFEGAVGLLGATEEMAPAIEASYETLLEELNAHLTKYDFLFGSRPSNGDFGLIGPLYAHLYRDPASGALMKSKAPAVAAWVERMQSPEPLSGDFLADDVIPETLVPILQRQMREQGPCLIDLVSKLNIFKTENPEVEIPRIIGMQAFTIKGLIGQRIIFPYTQWMLQRATDDLAILGGDDRSAIDALLKSIGGEFLNQLNIPAAVKRQNHKLIWA